MVFTANRGKSYIRRRAHHCHHGRTFPPCEVQASHQGELDPDELGEAGSWPLQEKEKRTEQEIPFLVEMQQLWFLGLLFRASLVVIFDILFVFSINVVCLSHRWWIMGKILITVVTIKHRRVVLQDIGYLVLSHQEVITFVFLKKHSIREFWLNREYRRLEVEGLVTMPRTILGWLSEPELVQ